MTSIFFSSSSNNHSPYPSDHYDDHLNNKQFLNTNYQAPSSSNSLTTHLFLSSNDQNGVFSSELHPPSHQHEGDNFGSQPYNDQQIENNYMKSDLNQVKWMSSKMRVMLKMKKPDQAINPNGYNPNTREVKKFEDHKHMTSPPIEENYISSNSTCSNNNLPIRVCSDCNTTKTPLWRSGPRGPKSLCNACGIRQRKARRAMAAAAAENNDSNVFVNRSIIAPLKVTKPKDKDHKKPHKGQVTKYKKRQYSKQITTITPPQSPLPSPLSSPSPSPSPSLSPTSSSPVRKNCVEEFLVSLRKNLTFYHVFPQDEKEAAILLMALSCGYAHES